MDTRIVAFAASLCFFVLSPALAQDLSGKYAVRGKASGGTQIYMGEASVTKKGDTYQVGWAMEDHVAIGTGILTGDVFAVTYIIKGLPAPGIALFERQSDGSLSGHFTLLGGTSVGDETWAPLDR